MFLIYPKLTVDSLNGPRGTIQAIRLNNKIVCWYLDLEVKKLLSFSLRHSHDLFNLEVITKMIESNLKIEIDQIIDGGVITRT